MAIFTYLDASGTADGPALSVAGFVATEAQWIVFDREWGRALAEYGVTQLHMKELAHWRGEFATWNRDEERRSSFLQRMTGIMNQYAGKSLGVTLLVKDYEEVDREWELHETFGGPYAYTALSALQFGLFWRNEHHPTEALHFFIERGDNDQGELFAVTKRIGFDFPVIQLPKKSEDNGVVRYVLPFQACDFIAWEQAKAFRTMLETGREEIVARKSILQIAPLEKDTMWRFIHREPLLTLCERLNIRRRVK